SRAEYLTRARDHRASARPAVPTWAMFHMGRDRITGGTCDSTLPDGRAPLGPALDQGGGLLATWQNGRARSDPGRAVNMVAAAWAALGQSRSREARAGSLALSAALKA